VKTDYDTENQTFEIQKPKPNRTTEKPKFRFGSGRFGTVRFGFRFMVKKCPPLGTVDQGRFTPRPRVSSSNGRTFDSPEAPTAVPPARVRLTVAKSSLGRHRNLRLARPQGSDSTSPPKDSLRLARPQGSDSTLPRTTVSTSLDPRARTQPQLRKTVSALPDPRARTQSRPQTTVSASPDPRARTQPRPQRSHRLARPRARTDHVVGGYIITLPLASSGYGEQDRRPIWLASVKQVMMAPRVLHDDDCSQPPTEARIRQQGSDSLDSCTSTGLKRSSDGHDAT
jgi:hypothetical protein